MNAPTELREATALLLQSSLLDEDTARLLTSDILDQPMSMEGASLDKNDDAGEEDHNDEDTQSNDESKQPPENADDCEEDTGAESPTKGNDASPSSGVANTIIGEEETQEPSESTSLLTASSRNDEMLRPSIFTMH